MARMTAIVLLKNFVLPDVEGLVATFARYFPTEAVRLQSPTTAGTDGVTLWHLDGQAFAVMPINSPMPGDDLEGPAREAVGWPDASAALKTHQAHVIIAPLQGDNDAPSTSETVASARRVTALAAMVAASADAVGVFFSAGPTVQSAATLRRMVPDLFAPTPPFPLWIGLLPFRGKNDTFGVLTRGLRDFIGRELHFQPVARPLPFLIERALGLTQYLLDQGPVLADGDTMGQDKDERLTVKHAMAPSGVPLYVVREG